LKILLRFEICFSSFQTKMICGLIVPDNWIRRSMLSYPFCSENCNLCILLQMLSWEKAIKISPFFLLCRCYCWNLYFVTLAKCRKCLKLWWLFTETCNPPRRPLNGYYSPVKTAYDEFDRVTYSCNLGYKARGGRTSSMCYLGFFSGSSPVCLSEYFDFKNTVIKKYLP